MYLGNQLDNNSDVEERIVYSIEKKWGEPKYITSKEEMDMIKLFHIKIHVKNTKVDALFDSHSQANIILEDMVSKLGLEVHDHPHLYPLGWVNKDVELKVMK